MLDKQSKGVYTCIISKSTTTTPDTAALARKANHMKASNGYTVERMSNTKVRVFMAGKRGAIRELFMLKGATDKPYCYCPVVGECSHVKAAMEFAATERKPVAVKGEYQAQMDMLMSPTGC